MSERKLRPWEEFIPEEERRVFEKAGYGVRQPFGRKPALVVIDVVTSFTGSKRQNVLEAIDEWNSACGDSAWEALPHIRQLIEGAREHGVEVIYTKGDPYFKSTVGDSTKKIETREQCVARYSTPIHPMIEPLDDEFVLTKTKASAFFATPLATYLNTRGIDSLILCGTSTSGCVRTTACDAWAYGYPVFVVEECCFDRSHFFHNATLYDLNAKVANVIQLEEALEWMASLPVTVSSH